MRIRIIYILTIVLILALVGIIIYYDSLAKNRCPDRCGDWIYGSCIDKQLYMERECYNYTESCMEEKHFERKTITVGACSQIECQNKEFVNYSCA